MQFQLANSGAAGTLARMSEAIAAIHRLEVHLTRASSAAGYYELGGLKLAANDISGAIAAYHKCLTLAPPTAAVYNNLGTALIKAGQFAAAVPVLEAALALQPRYARALVNLGKALREVGRVADALSRLREALSIEADYVPALINFGDALAADGEIDTAQEALERAVRLAPGLAEARASLGIARLRAGKIDESVQMLTAAVDLAPQHAEAHMNLGHALFVAGDWQAAWPHFEYRFARPAYKAQQLKPPDLPRWDGTMSSETMIWLVGEQGLGDQIQFARYATLLAERGMRCTLACDPKLKRLLHDSTIGVPVESFDSIPHDTGTCWFPLMSLPAWHRTDRHSVPAAGDYLRADPARVAHWRARLPGHGLRVALAWAGNPRMETGRHSGRSPPLESLAPLLEVSGIEFISLQKGAGEQQLDGVPFGQRIHRFADLDAGPDAFVDTAAILSSVDLLITSDSAIAHVAGALGVATWLCLMHEPDWRWMLDGGATPWYRSMRLFRQPARSNWGAVFVNVAQELAALQSSRRPCD